MKIYWVNFWLKDVVVWTTKINGKSYNDHRGFRPLLKSCLFNICIWCYFETRKRMGLRMRLTIRLVTMKARVKYARIEVKKVWWWRRGWWGWGWWWRWQGRRARVTSAELRSNLALNLSGGSSQPMFCASFSYTSSSPPSPLLPPHHHHHIIIITTIIITNIISITRSVPQRKGSDDIDENAYYMWMKSWSMFIWMERQEVFLALSQHQNQLEEFFQSKAALIAVV